MNRNRKTILTLGLIILLIGLLIYPKIDKYFKINSCLANGGGWNYETQECQYSFINPFLESKAIIKNPSIDTSLLFKIWALDLNNPHADFWIQNSDFYVVDNDGDGAMPYLLDQDSLSIFYNDFTQKGRIISVSKDSLIIHWNESDKPTEYVEWQN